MVVRFTAGQRGAREPRRDVPAAGVDVEGLLFTAAVLVALVVAVYLARSRRARTRSQSRQGRRQEVDPPGQRSAPDEWPRDGGDNPRAP